MTGTDVRNAKDRYLGSAEDVIVDPHTGKAAYLVVSRGGFLGIGEENVPVPWDQLKATPGLNTLVLDVNAQTLDKAPKVNRDMMRTADAFDQWSNKVDQYWQQKAKS